MMKISSNTNRSAGYTQENVSNYGLFEATNRNRASRPSSLASARERRGLSTRRPKFLPSIRFEVVQ